VADIIGARRAWTVAMISSVDARLVCESAELDAHD
jgi:hypothetical protein